MFISWVVPITRIKRSVHVLIVLGAAFDITSTVVLGRTMILFKGHIISHFSYFFVSHFFATPICSLSIFMTIVTEPGSFLFSSFDGSNWSEKSFQSNIFLGPLGSFSFPDPVQPFQISFVQHRVEDTWNFTSLRMIWAQKSFRLAFGCSILFSWAFRCRFLGLSPLKLYSMHLILLCLACADCSGLRCAFGILFISSSQPFSYCSFISLEKVPNFVSVSFDTLFSLQPMTEFISSIWKLSIKVRSDIFPWGARVNVNFILFCSWASE